MADAAARRQLGRIDSEALALSALVLRVKMRCAAGRGGHAIDLVREALDRPAASSGPDGARDAAHLAQLHALLGFAIWEERHDRAEALRCAWSAIGLHRTQWAALWLIREVEAQYSREARHFRFLLTGRGPLPADSPAPGAAFRTRYDVVADTLEEAFGYARRFEPPAVHESLIVTACKVLDSRPEDPKGVYAIEEYAKSVNIEGE